MKSYLVGFLVGTLGACTAAYAGFSELGARLPADTNAVVAMNLDALMQTPMAQKEDWMSRWTSMYEAGPLHIPPGTQRVISGSHLLHDLEHSKWQISIMQMAQQIPMQDIARNEAGTTEKLWNKPGVVSPTGAYFVAMEPNVLAAINGGDRQFVLSWIRDERPPGPSSPFIKQVLGALGSSSQITLALDVQDQYSPQEIQQAIEMNPLKSTGKEKVDAALLGQVLASIQSILVKVDVAETPKAQVNLQFGMDVALMEFYAKPLLMEIMDRNGFQIPEAKDWTVQVAGNRVVMEGELSRPSLRNVLGFITGPVPAYAEARGGAASDDPAAIGKASQAYYRSISAIIDNYAGQPSYSEASGWLRKEAQRIDRLAVVNVDPELAGWGAAVSSKMRQCAAMLKGEQMTGVAAVKNVSVANAGYGGGYYDGGYYGGDGYYNDRGNAWANADAQRQKSQAFTQQKAESMKNAAGMMSSLVEEKAQLRVRMSEKYKIPF